MKMEASKWKNASAFNRNQLIIITVASNRVMAMTSNKTITTVTKLTSCF